METAPRVVGVKRKPGGRKRYPRRPASPPARTNTAPRCLCWCGGTRHVSILCPLLHVAQDAADTVARRCEGSDGVRHAKLRNEELQLVAGRYLCNGHRQLPLYEEAKRDVLSRV